jgi:hypothetical protein
MVDKTCPRAISVRSVIVSGFMARTIAADVPRTRAHRWRHLFFRMVPPEVVYRMAAWRRSHGAGSGQLVLLDHGPGHARLRYSAPDDDDRAACLRRQVWAMEIAERYGGRRVTLREEGCLAERQPSCEYGVSWTEDARLTPAVIGGLLMAGGLFAASRVVTMPVAGWLLLPIVVAAIHVLERRRVARGNLASEAESGAGFRWLLDRALAGSREAIGEPVEGTPSPEAALPVLEQDGDFWRIGWEGTTVLLRHSRGLALLAHLVRCPGRDIHVRELDSITPSGGAAVAREAPAPDAGMLPLAGDGGEMLDAQARAEYRRRVEELREELDDAEQRHDLGRAEALRAELDLLVAELRAAVGAGGRARRVSSDVERERVAITRRIRSAIAQIAKHHRSLGEHLAATVTTGYYCAYRPSAAADPAPEPDGPAR